MAWFLAQVISSLTNQTGLIVTQTIPDQTLRNVNLQVPEIRDIVGLPISSYRIGLDNNLLLMLPLGNQINRSVCISDNVLLLHALQPQCLRQRSYVPMTRDSFRDYNNNKLHYLGSACTVHMHSAQCAAPAVLLHYSTCLRCTSLHGRSAFNTQHPTHSQPRGARSQGNLFKIKLKS